MNRTPNRLRHLRRAAGLTQSEAAARTGLRRQAIGLAEKIGARPHVTTIRALAEAYDTSTEDIETALDLPYAQPVVA
jgi:transcriptional regulator with XRE-family HTH domain